jgi:hypothetical protein
VTVRVTLYVPLTANIVENVEAVPVGGLPPVTAHAYVYGAVPPDTVEVKLTAVLTVPVVGPPTARTIGSGVTLTRAKTVFVVGVGVVESVTVSVTLYVPLTE